MFVFQEEIKSLDQAEASSYLLDLIRKLMIRDNLVRYFIKNYYE
nr:phycytochrome bilisome degradation protein [Timspurckia oligopyrenoides]UNJ17522.1 phycytochrome bilisome degradation protein [Timspurckia oligopyrenoides]